MDIFQQKSANQVHRDHKGIYTSIIIDMLSPTLGYILFIYYVDGNYGCDRALKLWQPAT